MSTPTHKRTTRSLRASVPVFAALGDRTRLELVARLSTGSPLSISRLAEGSAVTRQAITKHLRVLHHAGLVRAERRGRERVFTLSTRGLDEAHRTLDTISHHWDAALGRLRAHVESESAHATPPGP